MPRPSALGLAVLLLLGGCVSAPPDPGKRVLAPGDCLRKIEINQLGEAIRRCNAVVAAMPQDPQPRNDRALLHSLAGDNAEACRDSLAAAALLARQPKGSQRDRLMVEEIAMRRRSCLRLTTRPAAAAPSPAKPGEPAP